MRKFPRIWRVSATDDAGTTIDIGPPFRVTFKVKRDLSRHPNSCEIRIYNLAEQTRGIIEKGALRIRLYAGHAGVARLLFDGDLTRAWSEREDEASIVTIIFVGDGARAYAEARMNKSYRPPIRVATVLGDCAKSLGLKLPPEVEQSAELRQALEGGISLHGPTRDVLTRLLAPYAYHWSVQDGRLLIIRDEDLAPGEEFIVDADSGLIGSPKWRAPDKPRKKTSKKAKPRPEFEFDMILEPEMRPARRVRLRSEFFDVSLKALEVEHTGDSHGSDFTTKVKARSP